MRDEDRMDAWWRDGLCAQIGPDLFFTKATGDARAACRMCPVRARCLSDSLTPGLDYGVYGGFSVNARRPLVELVNRGADPDLVAAAAIAHEQEQRRLRRRRAS